MSRTLSIAATLMLLVAAAPDGGSRQTPGTPVSRPNVIYVFADDLGYGELGAYGQRKIRTPHLDQLAREGMRFTQHYTGAPVCAPSRGMLLTGLHAGHAYIRGNYELGGFTDDQEGGQMPLPTGTRTVAHLMRDAGYATAAIGKWGLGMHDNTGDPRAHGFDYFYGLLDQKQAHNYYPTHLWENGQRVPLGNRYFSPHQRLDAPLADAAAYDQYRAEDYAPELMTQKALAFIERHREHPFFLYLAYPLPHAALQAPEAMVRQYVGEFEEHPYLGQQGYLPTPYPLSTYAAMITTLDSYVGRVLDRLQALGLDERTIVMFSSDNGTTFNGGVNRESFDSTGGLRGAKMDVYEGGIRVPFLARWPDRIPQGAVSGLVSAQYDVLATLAELVGQETPPTDGVSMLPTLLGRPGAQNGREFLYFEYPEKGGQVAVRLGNWKGVKVDMKRNPNAPWQLYALEADVAETDDVAKAHPEILRRLDAIVAREHRRAHIREWEFIDSRMPPSDR
ncbi:MAG: arylsulfatase [Vicinamibacterales bacterium]